MSSGRRILFVSSGTIRGLVPFIKVQQQSLIDIGYIVDSYLISAKGFSGYRRSIKELKAYLDRNEYDVIHAHYSLAATVALLSRRKKTPIVCSFMGSDVNGSLDENNKVKPSSYPIMLNSIFIQLFVSHMIFKSEQLSKRRIFGKNKFSILPNGVNTSTFRPGSAHEARKTLNLPSKKNIWLFMGNPEIENKNFNLFKELEAVLGYEGHHFEAPYPIEHDKVNDYYNASTAMILASFAEGSPNVVKECMATDTPVISSPVGDIDYLFGSKPNGYYITKDFSKEQFLEKIEMLLANKEPIEGRKTIENLGLDARSVALKLDEIYKRVQK